MEEFIWPDGSWSTWEWDDYIQGYTERFNYMEDRNFVDDFGDVDFITTNNQIASSSSEDDADEYTDEKQQEYSFSDSDIDIDSLSPQNQGKENCVSECVTGDSHCPCPFVYYRRKDGENWS